jgi:hypothetical protein
MFFKFMDWKVETGCTKYLTSHLGMPQKVSSFKKLEEAFQPNNVFIMARNVQHTSTRRNKVFK